MVAISRAYDLYRLLPASLLGGSAQSAVVYLDCVNISMSFKGSISMIHRHGSPSTSPTQELS